MKKFFLILLAGTVASFSAIAQSEKGLKPFKVDVGVGYAMPGGKGAKGGVLFAVEPKYAVMNQLSVGLRLEAAVIARFSGYDADGVPNQVTVKAAASYLATGDYYFTNNYSFRPFVGAGAGIFSLAAAQATSTETTGVSTGKKFGGMIRGGIELSHFRLGVEYNIVPSTTFNGYDTEGNAAKITSRNSYIGFKLGVCFGGGPR